MKVLRWSCVLLVSSFFTFVFSTAASPIGLIPANASWRYLADGTNPGPGWNTLGFNDAAWPVGPAQLGYGEGDETTVVNTPIQRPVTVYFRRGVLIPSGTDLVLRLLRDDGAVVYFNGVEVRRDNMPAGPINAQTLASAAVGGADETTFFETIIPASAVVPGTNIVAVEVHQNSVTSSDLSFALELIANFESPFPLVGVTALDAEAREIPPWLDIPENPAVFQLRRIGGNTNNPLTVLVQLSGTAGNGVDYESVSNTVTIPAGSATANVGIHAIDDSLSEGTETVVLSIVPPPPIFGPEMYLPGTNSTATAFILDNDQTNSPPTVSIHRPLDGTTFRTPTNILLIALARDAEDGYDIAVEFFEGTNKIGNAVFIPSLCPGVECPSWYLEWANVPAANYTLTARATDKTGLMTISTPVHISVGGSNQPPERTVVSVVAIDPQAAEPYVSSNVTILNNGRFAIRRTGNMTSSIPVSFTLSGTAENGTDYTFTSNRVIIPAGSTQALVNVIPLSDNLIESTETVVLRIEPVFCAAVVPTPPECYLVGSPTQATIVIADRPATNRPPEVSISSPTDGAVFTAPASITIVAFASDSDNGAASIEFFESTNSLGFGIPIPTLCPIDVIHCPIGSMLTWANVAPGNYVLTAKATDNAGAITFSAPVHVSVVADTPGTNRTLVAMGSVWKYNDQCVDLGTAWRSVQYDDSTWASGPAQLGYGDGDEATVISPGPDPNARCITAYFRRSFIVSNAAGISQLSGRLLQDDGGVVYLNGVEIFRSNLPAGEVSRNTLATVSVENQIIEFTAPAGLLVNGPNVIAVEMHQASLSSGDLSFDLQLNGRVSPPTNEPPSVVMIAPENGATFSAPANIAMSAIASDNDSAIASVEFFQGTNRLGVGTPIAVDCSLSYCEGAALTWSNVPPGNYSLQAVAIGANGLRGTSAPVNVTVIGSGGTNNLPLVRVFASDQNASEGPSTNGSVNVGRFTFTRSGSISNSLPIFFQLSGTAANGVDYTLSNNFVVIPPGSSNVFVFVNPVDDAQAEETETVVATVIRPPPNAFSPPYNVGLPSSATVFIYDNDTNGPPTNVTLIAAGSVWKYLDNGSDQGTAWREPAFNDASWAAGPAQLGYGDGDEATVVSGGPDPQTKYITTYFRRAFHVADASAITDLTVRLLRDDGGVVYLNGVEVFRSNMSNGPVNYLTLAMLAAGGADETSNFYAAPINASLLVNGQNVIAVEIHQNSPLSSDISFDLELIANGRPQPPERTIVSVVALDPNASESGVLTVIDDGSFAVRRTGNLHADIPVFIRLTGSAMNGVDYAFLSNRVVIPAGSTQTVVRVVPLNDGLAEGTESVGLTIDPVACPAIFPPPPECYEVGSPNTATVFIADAPGGGGTNLPIVRVFATDSNATEGAAAPGTALGIGRFTFTRTGGSLTNPLPVYFVFSGTASNTVDYFATNRVVIPVGSTNASLFIAPIDDPEPEPTETVVVRLLSPPTSPDSIPYQVGSPSTATVFIHDNDMPTEPVSLIATGSVWKYLDNGTDQSTAWRAPGFDDASWASGPAQLGYGDGDEATVVSGGPDPQIRYITTYFRRSFNVSNPASFSGLTVRLLRDDGGVVYLNGVEVFRSNMPTGAVNYLTLALAAAGGEDETSNFYSASVDPSLLVNGQNVIAVEIHQVNPTSSDISFDLELSGTGGPQPPERTVISVVATDSQASEPVPVLPAINPGQFAIRRSGNLAFSIPVSFMLSGSASNGSDYAFISNHIVIPAGSTQALVNVVPLIDSAIEGTETVVLTLLSPLCIAIDPPPPECYLVGSPGQATVFITEQSSGTNRPPVAQWLAPPNGSVFTQGMGILLRASANDSDGTITRVEFRRGSLPIGLAIAAAGTNYSFLWSNPPVGSHTLFAIAVDNLNARGTSAPLSITVVGPPTNTPPTNATFTLAFNNRDGNEGVFFKHYTLEGPIGGGRLLPTTRVVPDNSNEWYYGAERQEIWRVNLASGQVEYMHGQIPPSLPEFSWPIGAAFDRIRNRVLVGTLGGEGFLYAYSTSNAQWSLVSSLNNRDFDCIVHHPADDSIYAVEVTHSTTPRLVKLDSAGNFVSELALPTQTFDLGRAAASSSELVSLGENLVLLIEANPNWYEGPGLESRIYLINPRTGEVRLTYSRAVPSDSDRDGVPDGEDQCPDTPLFSLVDQNGCSIQQRDSDHDGVLDSQDQCPNTPVGVAVDEHGCSASQRDADGDGVPNDLDLCANTPPGAIVNEQGCSIAQIAPCDGPWRNHGDYINAVRDAASAFYKAGLITRQERLDIVHAAAKSECGRRHPRLTVPFQSTGDIRTNGCRLVLEGDGPATCVIESSTDLIRWTPVSTNTLSGTTFEVFDPGACTAPRRFYRMRLE